MISPAQDPYASRTDRSSAIIARQDPVVYEDGQYANALSGEQVGQYERDGFLLPVSYTHLTLPTILLV